MVHSGDRVLDIQQIIRDSYFTSLWQGPAECEGTAFWQRHLGIEHVFVVRMQ